jgi:ATP-binding cassette subfamily B protein
MVLQDTWLFGGTIRDNLIYGRPGATEPEMIRAAEASFVDRFVRQLPDGYDTVIDEEISNLSAGQKQLITIAHRLSTIRDADLILVMEHGRIVEHGAHAELLAREGAYYRLYNAQFTNREDVQADPAR